MSTQETKLKAIADAIREKDGTAAPIPANDFAERIRAIETGSNFAVPLVVTSDAGTVITAVNGDATVTGTVGDSGSITLILPNPGNWSVTAQLGDKIKGPDIVSVQDGYTSKFQMVSRLPDGYTEVEYIESDGTGYPYIATNYTVTNESKIEAKFIIPSVLDGSGAPLITRYHSISFQGYQKYYGILLGAYDSENHIGALRVANGEISYDNFSKYEYTYKPDPSITSFVIDFPNKKFIVNDLVTNLDNLSSFDSGHASIYILSKFFSTETAYAKFVSFKYYYEGNLLSDFVPCINPSGVVGVYDTVKSEFIERANTGAFIAGPAV